MLYFTAAVMSKHKDANLGVMEKKARSWLKDAEWRLQDDGTMGKRDRRPSRDRR